MKQMGYPARTRCELKASRGFEPRSLDSESRALTVTPRGLVTLPTLTTTLFETLASARLCSSSPIDHVWGSPDGARLENRALMFLSTRWNVLRILKTSWRFSTSSPSCLPTNIRPAGPSLGARAQTRDAANHDSAEALVLSISLAMRCRSYSGSGYLQTLQLVNQV